MEFPVFEFVPSACCPVTGHHWERSSSVFFTPTADIYIHW